MNNPSRVTTPEQIAKFREMWAAGDLQSEIAEEFGIATSTVSNISKRLKLPQRYRTKNSDPEDYGHPVALKGGRWVRKNHVMVWVEDEAS